MPNRHLLRTCLVLLSVHVLVACSDSTDPDRDSGADAAIDASNPADGADAASSADGSTDKDGSALDGPGADATELPPLGDGVVTLAGSATAGDADGARAEAQFHNPVNVKVTADGTLLVSDFDNSTIRKVTPDGRVSTLVDSSAGIVWPFGLAIGIDGDLYVEADVDPEGRFNTGVLWRVDLSSGQAQSLIDPFGEQRGLVALDDGRLAASDYSEHTVSLVDPTGEGDVTLLAGQAGSAGFAEGTGTAARFDTPYDMVLTASNTLIVADTGNNRLREITLDGEVSTFAGTGAAASVDADDKLAAQFHQPQALAMDGQGNIYVADRGGYVIRRIASDGKVTTIAGDGQRGYVDNSDPLQARFYGMEGIALSPDGKYLYVADGTRGEEDDPPHNRIRRVTLGEQ